MASKWPDIQRVSSADDFEKIEFVEDMAMIEVPVECLDNLPFKNADRSKSARLRAVEKAIRVRGYDSLHPIIVRLGRRGRGPAPPELAERAKTDRTPDAARRGRCPLRSA